MRAARNSRPAKVVALAWAQGTVCNPDIRAAFGCDSQRAGAILFASVNTGHIHKVPGARPAGFALTPERAAAIASMPAADQQHLRTLAEQLAAVTRRVRAAQEAQRQQRAKQVRDERDLRAIAQRQLREADRLAARAATKAQRQAAKAALLREPTAAQRPLPLPGSRLVAPPPVGTPAPVTVPGLAEIAGAAAVQDPKGLLAPRPELQAAPAPFLVRGGHLAPNDGPYIRPGGLAHLAAPSRRADALVAHRAPLSQP